jgi:hypothetical protein
MKVEIKINNLFSDTETLVRKTKRQQNEMIKANDQVKMTMNEKPAPGSKLDYQNGRQKTSRRKKNIK